MTAQVALDEAFLGMMRNPSRYPTDADYAGLAAELATAADLYAREGWIAEPRSYHRDPPPLTDLRVRRLWAMNVWYERLSWPSGYETHPGEPNARAVGDLREEPHRVRVHRAATSPTGRG